MGANILIVQMKKLMPREGSRLSLGHIVKQGQNGMRFLQAHEAPSSRLGLGMKWNTLF